MPDLLQSLQNHDIGFLRIVAGLWGVDLESKDLDDATSELAASLLDPDLALELVTSLNSEARSAVEALAEQDGRMPWAAFARRFGQVREMGAAKRDREKPHLNPASTSEVLFYRALLFRAFFNTDKGPQEFAYIPDGLLEFVAPPSSKPRSTGKPANSVLPASPVDPSENSEPPGRGATPGERKHVLPANDRILDDATTLLAALRSGHEPKPDPKLSVLLAAAGLISVPAKTSVAKSSSKPQSGPQINSEKARAFLEAARPAALQMLIDAWRNSEAFNELRLMPGLVFEGEWENQPVVTRDFLLDLLQGIPDGAWWSLNAFIGGVKKTYADFQRPAGDYDSWFIKRAVDGTYLRGFAYWDQVDGALIRFFITDILYWLGMLELGAAEEGGPITAFHLLESSSPKVEENGKIAVASNGRLSVPRSVQRAVRYQLSRFCEWDDEKPDGYHYHPTPQSLLKAREQGLKVEHLLSLLARHADAGIPPALVKALKRWELNGTEAKAETQVILRVSRPEVLEELRKSKAARFLSDPLGPTTIVIKAGAQPKVMAALAELGLLAEDNTAEASDDGEK